MTYTDKLYKNTYFRIKNEGFNEKNMKNATVRPVWDEGGIKTPAYTILLPQVVSDYPKGITPITNIRNIAWKSGIKEILWIYQDKSNDVDLLKEKYNVNYWDEWKNSSGDLGTAYGYQVAKEFTSPETKKKTNQIDRLLYNLKNDPLNRRHIMTMIDMDDISDMTLIPCAFMTLWTVVGDQLNLTLIQRSGDFLAAASPGGINAIQYYALLLMVAKHTGYTPGRFVHFVQNLHVYDRHMPILEDIITKREHINKDLKEPTLILDTDKTNFYDFTIEDFQMINYTPDTTKYTIPIAI